eukprot:TRINITY_DN22322_c0_g1_i1.p1 TRINITY_DN22322_c0_g1~~TRINITY_DN22322_c0_g1_i1.p1  ORF type:complete len:362 (+),score=110.97 TRINITY_DN22322_c0_g1_i1:63-1088(+)
MDIDRVPMDRGKRINPDGQHGNVLFADPRKPPLRFGHDAESSHASVSGSTKHRIRKHLLTAVQRHVLQKAMGGAHADLSRLGGLGLAPPQERIPLPERSPAAGRRASRTRRSRGAASVCSSQSLGTVRSSIRAPPTPSEQLDPERAEWADVIKCNAPQSEYSLHLSHQSSLRSSKVRDILTRCEELKAEISSERRAASNANKEIERRAQELSPQRPRKAMVDTGRNTFIPRTPMQAPPAAAPAAPQPPPASTAELDELRALAKKNPAVRRRVKKAYEKLEACIRNDDGLPRLDVAHNPFRRLAPGYNARRHYKRKYDGEMKEHDLLNASAMTDSGPGSARR